jgi:Protein of unknown function (DUF3237)
VDPSFRPLFTIEFQTTPQIVGTVPAGYFRRTGIIQGGSFEGDRLSGKALPGGGDWVLIRPDGITHLDVRAMLETDRGETIYMTYTGRLKMPAGAAERLAAGETLTEAELYFRTAVQFETAAADLLWLNDIVAVGIGHRRASGPVYRIFEML